MSARRRGAAAVLLLVAGSALADPASPAPESPAATIELLDSRLGEGGGTASGGSFTIAGALADPGATAAASGGTYTATGGLWPTLSPPGNDGVFLDSFE